MNGPHDVGGKQGFGTLAADPFEGPWHEEWEGRMCGVSLALAAIGNHTVDAFRYALERMPYAPYYASSYFERWLWTIELILHENGRLTHEELDARVASQSPIAERPPSTGDSELAARMRAILCGPLEWPEPEAETPPAFAPGDAVRARNLHIREHLRLPGYAKNRTGVVYAHRGAFNHPQHLAHRPGAEPEFVPAHLYTVGFKATELWGESAERPDDDIYLELFEDYLDAA